ncbi:MAG: hypothetical protein ACX93N_06120 [Pseudohaliea sp.]
MRTPLFILLALAAAVARAPATALEAEADLATCKRWHQRIERYTRLRRGGGSAVQMERWRQARAAYEAKFRAARCHRWGRQLRDG